MITENSEKCQGMINKILEFSCQKEFSEQMETARELFSMATGKVTDEDAFYESRLSLFQHFFAFEYRLSSVFSGSTIFELFLLRLQGGATSKAEIFGYEHLRSARRSLFRVEKHMGDSKIVVWDLFARTQLEVNALPEFVFNGFETGAIFEGRVFSFLGDNYFAGAFVFHPHEVRELIEKRIREFLLNRTFQKNSSTKNWEMELKRRSELIATLAEQKRLAEVADKRKSIEVLNVNKLLAKLSQEMGGGTLSMALGCPCEISAFVPESLFYDVNSLMDSLSYSELKCTRFRHINPQKLYAPDGIEFGVAQSSRPNSAPTAQSKGA